jgi:hypothetical protein
MNKNQDVSHEKGEDVSKSFVSNDEKNLTDYCVFLWKRKIFVFLATVLPTVCIAAILWFLPRNYSVAYIYKWEMNKKNYDILLSQFYSEDNLSYLIDLLEKQGMKEYAIALNQSRNFNEYEGYIKLEALPHFLDLSKSNIDDPEKLEKINNLTTSLLNVTIVHNQEDKLFQVAAIIRNNIEQAMPLYLIQEQLSTSIQTYNSLLADIERNRFSLEIELKNNNETITALKSITVGNANDKQNDITLQFDIGEQSQYLPLSYQIQAAESKGVKLEETIKINESKYNYYKDLIALNTKILAELDTKLPSHYTIEQFKGFLMGLSGGYEKTQIKDYLNSYIRAIENRISASKPVMAGDYYPR